VGESAENLLPADTVVGEVDRFGWAGVSLSRGELAKSTVRPGGVVAAPRGAVLDRPRSGQGREEMSLDPMPNLAPKG
jgi:hypothetical protein